MIIKTIAENWRRRFGQELLASYGIGDAMDRLQYAIRSWMSLYSVYQTDKAFVGALQMILRDGKHTAEEVSGAIPILLAGPGQHSDVAKAGWQNKVVPYIRNLQTILVKNR